MTKIYTKLFNFLEIGDAFPTIIMGVLNLSPESFYQGSIYQENATLEAAALNMIQNGAKILDLGARSTAPWSKKITIDEELKRLGPAMNYICQIIPEDVILSIDTQYKEVAQRAFEISQKYKKKILINDVSCLKTDPSLGDFVIEHEIPLILMASKKVPGDILTIEEIISEFRKTIRLLKDKGYYEDLIILDPGIGRWIDEKIHLYDLKIIARLKKLRVLERPILIALSRKSFVAGTLGKYKDTPELRYDGTLSATAISIFNGAHIVRTHDVNNQLVDLAKIAEEIRKHQ
ncbi:MAG: dihydropteroate synthase [Promethearchaeota archaeon]